jgi:hypothetical protein
MVHADVTFDEFEKSLHVLIGAREIADGCFADRP